MLRAIFPSRTVDQFCPWCLVGLREPDPAIHRALGAMSARQPEEIAFVDDFAERRAAVDAGIVGIGFTGESALRERLRELGLGLP